MSPDKQQQRELNQIAEVLRLEQGELSYEPGFGLSYDGAPEWAESELNRKFDYPTFCTVVVTGGGFVPEPKEGIIAADGSEWVLVAALGHSAECECPAMHYDPFEHTDSREPRKVTRKEAVLRNRYPKGKRAECYYCEARIGEEHGYIYIGEGYEAVYKLVEATEEECAE